MCRYMVTIILGFGLRQVYSFWPPAYKVDLHDHETFVIASDDDDEDENEMIRPKDLTSIVDDEAKYEPLHSHVERYNKLVAATATKFADVLLHRSDLRDSFDTVDEEAKPFVAGFKKNLDQYFRNLDKKTEYHHRDEMLRQRSSVTSLNFNSDSESSFAKDENMEDRSVMIEPNKRDTNQDDEDGEAVYDYEQFKAEYYDEIEHVKKDNKTLNYTENGGPEETIQDAVDKIIDFKMPKNCTKEELTQFGAKSFECLAYDLKHAPDRKNAKKMLYRTWTVIRVWICIYLCIAIPCWCQKGWCCCCFRCKFCKPRDRIRVAKKYYTENPPGLLVTGSHENEQQELETNKFEPTLFELEVYDKFGSAIRNL